MPHSQSETIINLGAVKGMGIAHLDQYFGLWAVDQSRFLSLFDRVSRMDLIAHINQARAEADPQAAHETQISRTAGIAIISVEGTMTKYGNSLDGGGSTIMVRQALRNAAGDRSIDGILLRIDSPGGTVAGTADLAADVLAARKQKPVYAFIEDLGASAAYWVASQADKVFANDRTALIGSIGTFIGLYDFSELAKSEGIKPIVIKTGSLKAVGFEGTEITEEHQAYLQDIVDKTQSVFGSAVAKGRGLNKARIRSIESEARVYAAPDAQELGLIDGIQSIEETIRQLAGEARSRSSAQRNATMSDTTPETKEKASIADLKAAFTDDPDFALKAAENEWSLQEAKAEYCDYLQAKLQNRDEEIKQKQETISSFEASHKEAATIPVALTGAKPVSTSPATVETEANVETGDPIEDFNASVLEKVGKGVSRQLAVLAVIKANPQLHQDYLLATNSKSSARGLIKDKFALA